MAGLLFTAKEIENIIDELLNMDPDPIPRFILLKEGKGLKPSDREYQNAYDQVLAHPFTRQIVRAQTPGGYWGAFHGDSEAVIRQALWMGLTPDHPSLQKVIFFLKKVLLGEGIFHQRCEKHDNPRWWLEIFMPLCAAATLSLLAPEDLLLEKHISLWRSFAEAAFAGGQYDPEDEWEAQYRHFQVKTKRRTPFYGYYSVLLLTAQKGLLPPALEQKILAYCLHREEGMYYIYDKNPSCLVPITATKDFYHWLRTLTILSRFAGWEQYKSPYYNWVWQQRNADGFWDLMKKPRGHLQLSDSWRTRKNRIIDSSIFVLRFLMNKPGY